MLVVVICQKMLQMTRNLEFLGGVVMNKIEVLYENRMYYWVDTVVRHDEYEYTCAVLVNPRNGSVFQIDLSKIIVTDTNIFINRREYGR